MERESERKIRLKRGEKTRGPFKAGNKVPEISVS